MRICHQKAIKLPAALALSLGLVLGSMAGLPASASAATGMPPSAVTALTEPPDRRAQLEKALLTKEDLPAGYESLDMGFYEPLLREMLGGQANVGGDPCAIADRPPEISASPLAMPVQSADLIPAVGPVKTLEPVKTVEPVKTGPAKKAEPKAPEAPPAALAVFEHADEGSMVMEVLSAAGENEAGAAIASLRTMLKKCPELDLSDAELTVKALDWQQRLGDDSVAVEMMMRSKIADTDLSMRIRAVQVAYRDVSLIVGLMETEDPGNRRLKKIARAAVRKLVTSSGISTK
jgi:hypothetical protein